MDGSEVTEIDCSASMLTGTVKLFSLCTSVNSKARLPRESCSKFLFVYAYHELVMDDYKRYLVSMTCTSGSRLRQL